MAPMGRREGCWGFRRVKSEAAPRGGMGLRLIPTCHRTTSWGPRKCQRPLCTSWHVVLRPAPKHRLDYWSLSACHRVRCIRSRHRRSGHLVPKMGKKMGAGLTGNLSPAFTSAGTCVVLCRSSGCPKVMVSPSLWPTGTVTSSYPVGGKSCPPNV